MVQKLCAYDVKNNQSVGIRLNQFLMYYAGYKI